MVPHKNNVNWGVPYTIKYYKHLLYKDARSNVI